MNDPSGWTYQPGALGLVQSSDPHTTTPPSPPPPPSPSLSIPPKVSWKKQNVASESDDVEPAVTTSTEEHVVTPADYTRRWSLRKRKSATVLSHVKKGGDLVKKDSVAHSIASKNPFVQTQEGHKKAYRKARKRRKISI